MKRLFIKLLLIILTLNFILGTVTVNATSELSLEEKQRSLLNVANTYYSKGVGIQYDQKRRFLDEKPEEAKDKWPIYLDCSSFVYNVYRQTFGVELQQASNSSVKLQYTSRLLTEAEKECKSKNRNTIRTSGVDNDYIVCYVNNINGIASKLKNLKKILQPGDLIVYREIRESNGQDHGHVVMYIGNEQVIHCTGTRYNYDTCKDKRENAGIVKSSLNSLIVKGRGMYLAKAGYTKKFAVIRPLNAPYMKNAQLTEYAEVKNEIPDLSIKLNSDIGNLKTVSPGKDITFSLILSNNGKEKVTATLVNQKVSDYLNIDKDSIITTSIRNINGENVERQVVKTIKIDGNNNLSCKINTISPGVTIKIKYTAKVNSDVRYSGKTIESQVNVGKSINGVDKFESTNKIIHTIGRTLNSSEISNLVSVADKYVGSQYSGNTRNLVDTIYKEAFNTNCGFGNKTIKSMLNDTMSVNDKLVKLTSNNTKARRILLENMYGYNLEKYNIATTGTRSLNTENLIPGDVIIYAYNSGSTQKYVMYLYVSSNKLISVSGGRVVAKTSVQNKLDNIIGKDRFAVLRPSLDM